MAYGRKSRRLSPLYEKYHIRPTGDPLEDWQIELACWANPQLPTGFPAFYHFEQAIHLMWPDNVWHSWRERRFEEFANMKNWHIDGNVRVLNMSWIGCGAAGKTYDASMLALAWWLVDPENSIVEMTSTTKDSARQRMWAVLQTLYWQFREEQGDLGYHLIDSQMILEAIKGERKHAIYTMAVESGELTKTLANIQGRHARRMLLVIDEAMGTPEAIFSAIPNIFKGASEVALLFISNAPLVKLNPFMKLACPTNGWSSVSPDEKSWKTKPVPAWQIPEGVCLHFSGKDSPNVVNGKTIFPFLYSLENWRRVEGNAEISKTPQFWSQDLGFPPPEGALFTVLTESLIEARDAEGHHTFRSFARPMAGLDPSWGNDECKLVFGVMGDIENGVSGLQITEHMTIYIEVGLKDAQGRPVPTEYQIAGKVIAECSARGIPPAQCGIMAGGNPGVLGVLEKDWGEIYRVEESGAPSDLPVSMADMRPSSEVYDRRVTELYFFIYSLVDGGQLKGLYEDAKQQFCGRLYDLEKKGRKKAIEKKEDFKPRFGRSPDDAEAIIAMAAVARTVGLEPRGLNYAKRQELDISAETEQQSETAEENDTRMNDSFDAFSNEPDPVRGFVEIHDDGRSGYIRRGD